MKSIKKLITLLLIICVLSFIFCETTVNAQQINNAIIGAQNFINSNSTSILNKKAVYDVLNVFYGLLLAIAIAFAVIKGILIGMQFVWGSIEDKVDAKSLLVPYAWILIGIALGGTILRIFLEFMISLI